MTICFDISNPIRTVVIQVHKFFICLLTKPTKPIIYTSSSVCIQQALEDSGGGMTNITILCIPHFIFSCIHKLQLERCAENVTDLSLNLKVPDMKILTK